MKFWFVLLLMASCVSQQERRAPRPTPAPVETPVVPVPAPKPEPVPEDISLPLGACNVVVCNKLERFSLSVWSHVKDSIGETCFTAVVGTYEAQPGRILHSESRWYQGRGINPTKKSVTRVERVTACNHGGAQ